MKKSYLRILMAAALSAGVSGTALAADEAGKPGGPRAGGGQFFERLDTDGDGKISEAEAPAQAWERMSKADTDGDGAVSKEELAAAMKARAGAGGPGGPGGAKGGMADMMMQRLDTDKDGKITEAEAGERWGRMSQLDKNGDGAVTKDELPAGKPGAGKPGAGGPGKPGSAGAGGANRGEFFAKADANGDEKLTEDEVPAQAWERLSKLDSDLDGAVSKAELAKVMDRAGSQKKGSSPEAGSGTKPKRPPVEE